MVKMMEETYQKNSFLGVTQDCKNVLFWVV
jgi:hypothetical protein